MSSPVVLQVRGLQVEFHGDEGHSRAVDRVDLDLHRGEVLGLVGESGCGKSTIALSLLGLLPGAARVPSGNVSLNLTATHTRTETLQETGGDNASHSSASSAQTSSAPANSNLLSANNRTWRKLRGRRIAMIFQDPMTSLNPYMRIGVQVTEHIRHHLGLGRQAAREHAIDLLQQVGIPDPAQRLNRYPHECSGGQRQRIGIAIALACNPDIIIADEPTTALDVTIQAQILDLLRDLQRQRGMAMILVSHDLGVIAGCCDRVAVMYAGRIVEQAQTEQLFAHPLHPYTRGLIASIPRLEGQRGGQLATIPGMPPRLRDGWQGCAFASRCRSATPDCAQYACDLSPASDPDDWVNPDQTEQNTSSSHQHRCDLRRHKPEQFPEQQSNNTSAAHTAEPTPDQAAIAIPQSEFNDD